MTVEKYFIGVDVGTYESKGVITDLHGHIIASRTMKHTLSVPRPGWAEHDPEGVWWNDVCAIIRGLLQTDGVSPKDIAAVCCSAVSCGIVAVDSDDRPLRPAILYGVDTRSTKEIDDIICEFGREKLIDICGELPSVDSYGPKLLWLRRNEPEIFSAAARFTFAQGYINLRLTGRNFIDSYSVFFSTPLFNCSTRGWDAGMCRYILGEDGFERLPQIAPPSSVIGTVTRRAAAETGLAEGTPVVCGATDAGSEALSVGVFEPGDTMVMYGSSLFINHVTPSVIIRNNPLWKAHFLFGDSGCVLAGMATTGSLTRWLRDNFTKDYLALETQGSANAYDSLFAEADTVPPGSDGVFVLPYFAGERMPIMDAGAKGMIFGLTLGHTRAHVIRAALEGVGYGLRQNFEVMRAMGCSPGRVTAVGGGTKSPEWMQIMSDVTGCEHCIPEITTGASFGDAMLCAAAVGAVSDLSELKRWNRIRSIVSPRSEYAELYERGSRIYRELYENTRTLMHSVDALR